MTKILNEIRQHGSLFSPKNHGKDVFKVTIPPGEEFLGCRITILDARFGGITTLDSVPPAGKIGKSEIKVSWQCGDLADVKYQVEAFTKPINSEAGEESLTKQMTGFLPSQNGWPFDNRFAKVPPFKLIGNLKFGDASNGLCGGMVYAALDYFFAGLDVPTIPEEDLSKYKSPMQGKIFDIKELRAIAKTYGKDVAQVVLRWSLQKGVVTIPKSVHRDRIISNAQIFDFELSAEDMVTITRLDKNERVGADPDNFNF